MTQHINSTNQNGGITAHTVNIGMGIASAPQETPKALGKQVGAWIVGIATVVATAVAILQYLNVPPPAAKKAEVSTRSAENQPQDQVTAPDSMPKTEPTPMPQEPKNINITSINQSGGITAHTVNVGPQPRTITPQFEQELIRVIAGYKKVTVTCVLGDGEGFQFASAITNYLKAKGINVEGVNQAVFSAPVLGQQANPNGDTMNLVIGTRQ